MTIKIIDIPLEAIATSPLHFRTVWDLPGQTLEQLGESLKERQLVEIRVRIVEPGKYEPIDGARRIKAAGLAGLKTLRGIVEDVDDCEVLRRQLVHASGIALHPMDEAQILEQLVRVQGRTLAQVVDETGIDADRVRRAIKLCDLCPEGRKLYAAGQIGDDIAFAAARVASPKEQAKALKEITTPDEWGDTMGDHGALQLLRRLATRHLELAVWPMTTSLAGKMPCAECPERTLSQLPLFADLYEREDAQTDDYCANPACWAVKLDATVVAMRAQAEEAKLLVLTGKKAAEVFNEHAPAGGRLREPRYGASYADADQSRDMYGNETGKSPRALGVPLVAFAVDPDGVPRWLCDVKAATSSKRSAERKSKSAPAKSAAEKRDEAKRKAERTKVEQRDIADRALVIAAAKAARDLEGDPLIAALLDAMAKADAYNVDEVAKARGMKGGDELLKAATTSRPDRRELVAHLVFAQLAESDHARNGLIAAAAKAIGVNVAAVTKAALKAHAEAAKAEQATKPGKGRGGAKGKA